MEMPLQYITERDPLPAQNIWGEEFAQIGQGVANRVRDIISFVRDQTIDYDVLGDAALLDEIKDAFYEVRMFKQELINNVMSHDDIPDQQRAIKNGVDYFKERLHPYVNAQFEGDRSTWPRRIEQLWNTVWVTLMQVWRYPEESENPQP